MQQQRTSGMLKPGLCLGSLQALLCPCLAIEDLLRTFQASSHFDWRRFVCAACNVAAPTRASRSRRCPNAASELVRPAVPRHMP
eukprot:scaffold244781_cov10-Tisochrysis_lutea.AAC.1